MGKLTVGLTAAALCTLFSAACAPKSEAPPSLPDDLDMPGGAQASATLLSPGGGEIGRIVFAEGPRGVLIRLDIGGLAEGWHGIHLHDIADCTDGGHGFVASGGHVNPAERPHGLLNPDGDHPADLPNIYAGPDGRATAELYRAGVALSPSETVGDKPVLLDDDGFAVIIHAQPDDHRSQPIGGAGERVACAALTNRA